MEHDEPMGVITTRSEMGAEGPVPPLRTLWQLLETYHSLVYYAPERADRYARLGLAGGWMGYFATRSAALGTVPPSVVTACFYGFAHRLVARALPDAWTRTTPADALAARYDVVDAAATRLLGPHGRDPRVAAVAELLVRGVGSAAPHGRPMFAAHAHLPCPDAPHLALFWAATALRELRGDAHVVALQTSARVAGGPRRSGPTRRTRCGRGAGSRPTGTSRSRVGVGAPRSSSSPTASSTTHGRGWARTSSPC